ncbi:hypothetical protein [Flavobacterium sp. 3HN19-14]|uniref:hypothetical protein n=1 Tax=Flavobacterium sp. 3HN19-14 TaxID=3448133 RepID=UPI003EE3AED5
MRRLAIWVVVLSCILLFGCAKKVYATNGETIYKTGRNLNGDRLLDRSASTIPFVHSCIACHGRKGNRMESVSVQFRYLSDPANFKVSYNDSLFFRFLDHDLKSDGQKANIGVIWKMSDGDKKDLLDYLKQL